MGWGLTCNHKHHLCSNGGLRRLHPAIQKHFTISLLPWSFHALDLRIDLHYAALHKHHHALSIHTSSCIYILHKHITHCTLHIAPPQHEARAHLTCICLHTPIRHSSLYAIVATRNSPRKAKVSRRGTFRRNEALPTELALLLREKSRSAVGKASTSFLFPKSQGQP